ncbi:sulfatase-like hydrolase/transferase [bacterium]|nr:sulfatase-like hydrolase/transferase [candidate division CSSED10-310 bacterium]
MMNGRSDRDHAAWFLCLTLSAMAVAGGCGPQPTPMNLVVITVDTTRADHIGCYGYDKIRTPNIDGLAAGGVQFDETFSVQPVTLPAHCSIFTGTYPFTHGVRDNNIYRLGDQHRTLAEVLEEKGYLTTAFVASYILNNQFGLNQGFRFYNDRFVKPKQKGRLPVDRRASEVSFLAVEWLDATEEQRAQQPFFLWLHYYDPHADYDPPHPYKTAYPEAYDGEIAYMDDWLGYFFSALRDRGLWDHTIVALVADHGESLGEFGERTHGMFIYRGATHVPMIIRAPGLMEEGLRIGERVSQVDLMPTLLALLGIEPPPAMDGISLLPLVNGGKSESKPVYSEAFIPRSFNWSELKGVRFGDWFFIQAPEEELYSIATPGPEGGNMVKIEPAAAASLRERLLGMVAGAGDARAEHVAVTDEMVERLRALGYFVGGGAAGDGAGEALPDPKERIGLFNLYQQASGLLSRKNLEEGAALLEKLVEEDPGNSRFLMELGDVYTDLGQYERAEELLIRALQLRAQDAGLEYLLGLCYESWGKPDRALAHYDKALAMDEDHFLTQFHVGLLSLQAEDWPRAEAAFLAAHRLKESDPATLNNLGFIEIRGKGDAERGLEYIEQARKYAPRNHYVLASLGSAYGYLGRNEEARELLEQALELVPDSLTYMNELAAVYEALGDKDGLERLAARRAMLE